MTRTRERFLFSAGSITHNINGWARIPWVTAIGERDTTVETRYGVHPFIHFVILALACPVGRDDSIKIELPSEEINEIYSRTMGADQSLTCMMARITQRPPIRPTSTHVKILQRVFPSPTVSVAPVLLSESAKKLLRQLLSAVLCLDAEIIIQVKATAKPATVIMM